LMHDRVFHSLQIVSQHSVEGTREFFSGLTTTIVLIF
jgi:hypothetical protein